VRPTYPNHPGHAEALEIVYRPTKTDYRALLEFFFQIHDPSTKDRQGNDRGTSYQSAMFYLDDDQREAEPEHHDYLLHYPNGDTCHYSRPGWTLPTRAQA
jgi:peptide-methionine (S)-S-oxide reductase